MKSRWVIATYYSILFLGQFSVVWWIEGGEARDYAFRQTGGALATIAATAAAAWVAMRQGFRLSRADWRWPRPAQIAEFIVVGFAVWLTHASLRALAAGSEVTGLAAAPAALLAWKAGVVPVCEELIWRGIVLRRFVHKFGLRMGVVASALVFAIPHTDIPSALFFGVVASVAFLATGTLWAPVLLHVVNNALVFGVEWAGVAASALPLIVCFALAAILVLVWTARGIVGLTGAEAAGPRPRGAGT